MPLPTTVIGSFPKPEYLDVPDWFKTGTSHGSTDATNAYSDMLRNRTAETAEKVEGDFLRATQEVIGVQCACGVDVVTDGEIRRENYIHYFCRFIDGIDFANLTTTSCRNGAYVAGLPTVKGPVTWRGPLDVAGEWSKAQALSPLPVKYTLPGPMTIIGTVHNAYYESEEVLGQDLATIVNFHVRALAEAGCKHIQVDEPVFARHPDKALAWGIRTLDRCFEGVGEGVTTTMHMCCGYPGYLDDHGYLKADPDSYFRLAPALDESQVDAISLEDAHRYNDLSLLRLFKKKTVIFGAVTVASSRVEPQEEIEARLRAALEHIDAERLVVAPDCGLGLLPMEILKQKISNMCAAAKACGP